ncbi:MAG TPA: ferredoxin family protein [Streptosporangiaceae bacterium]|nr:ferredoxin family protein [Streptosporangiaceae bacterium]
MTYVIGQPCVDVMDRSRIDECPVDEEDLPEALRPYLADNEAFFAQALPGRDDPIGNPGGAARLGVVGADTSLVAGLPPQAPAQEA